MSLWLQINKPASPLGGFLRKVFPSQLNRRLLAEIKIALNDQEAVCLLEKGAPVHVYGLIGKAIDYRIRYHFDPTPAGRLTWAGEGAWAVTKLDDLVRILQRNPSVLPGYALTPQGDTPERAEDWLHFADFETEEGDFTVWSMPDPRPNIPLTLFSDLFQIGHPDFERIGLSAECTLEFFDLLDRTIGKIAPHLRLPTRVEELTLARFCLVLGVFESVRRSGRGWPPSFLGEIVPRNSAGILEAVPDSWVEDVAELAGMFAESHADWRGAPATLNPKFAGAADVGGADGDLIVDGCLWDIKTTIKKRADGNMLYQLLGYVLLDYEDEYAIDSVGFLFPRQNNSIRWSLAELMRELSGQADISPSDLRRQLRQRLRPDS